MNRSCGRFLLSRKEPYAGSPPEPPAAPSAAPPPAPPVVAVGKLVGLEPVEV